jgi:hypothetical protein
MHAALERDLDLGDGGAGDSGKSRQSRQESKGQRVKRREGHGAPHASGGDRNATSNVNAPADRDQSRPVAFQHETLTGASPSP